MATKIATYRFDNSSDFQSAKDRISSETSYGWDTYSWDIFIYDSCEKASLVGQICRAHGGKSI